MALERVLRMNGGVAETSYATNSLLQRKVIMEVNTILKENLELMMSNTKFEGCCKVADLGCSSGINTLMVISNILNVIAKTSMSLNHEAPVFQVYLNDLFENDFNNIFKLLPGFYKSIQQDNVGACFINATPGNFYGRLFPKNYINFFHSSFSIHWLSQAPKADSTKKEPLNNGNIHLTRSTSPLVYDAYLKQFESDFKSFLESRFEELVSGGVMILSFLGRETPYKMSSSCEVLDMVLNELVQEGLVEEGKVDMFDFPVYQPTIEEVREVIEADGCFSIQILKSLKIGWDEGIPSDIGDDGVVDSKKKGEIIAKYHRAVFEPLLIAGFGENIMDEFFSRFAKMAAHITELEKPKYNIILLVMTKDPDWLKRKKWTCLICLYINLL